MSQLSDLILKTVQGAVSNSNLSSNALNGLSESIVNSLKQTAQSKGGIEQLTALFTGQTSAASSPITALASKLFTSQATKLGLSSSAASSAAGMLPQIVSALVSAVVSKKVSGLDLGSILSSLGASSSNSTASKLGYIAGTLGKLFKKK